MEQEKIDLARATPVPDTPRGSKRPPVRRGAPLWLQIILSLVVLAIAAAIAGVLLPSANTMLAQIGVKLPLLTGTSDSSAPGQGGPQAQPQAQAQGAQGQRQGGQGQGSGQGGAGRQGGGQGGGQFGANRVAVVVALPATTGTINNQLTAIGEGVAVKSVTVNTASGGTLMTIDVKPGDQVAAGAKLATLDSDTQQNAVDKAQVALSDADNTLARTQALGKTNAVPATQVDAAKLADDNARLALQAAQIALTQRTITTPIAGTVGLIQVQAGNLINAQSVVTTIEDDSSILVNFWVPERYSSQIKLSMPVDVTSAALPGKSFTGTVTAIDNKIDPESRTLQLQATIPNPNGIVKPGMSFSVDMKFAGETFPSVDPLAIQWSNQGAYVWKVADNKAVKGMVDIVQRNTDGVLVKGDVKPGDMVVTQGVLQLSDGLSVRQLAAGPTDATANANGKGSATGSSGGQKGPLPPDKSSAAGAQGGAAPQTAPATDQTTGGQASAPAATTPVASAPAGASRQSSGFGATASASGG